MNHARLRSPTGLRRRVFVRSLLVLVLLVAGDAIARQLPQPTGPVLLTVTGKIGQTNRNGAALFDEEMLSGFPLERIVTTTPWTNGIKHFEGVLLSDLLREVDAAGQVLLATAINSYRIEIPASDAGEFGILLALRMDGERLSRRDRGPVWIVYPRDTIPRIQDERYDSRWVWQLDRLEVR